MKLTSENVRKVFDKCFCENGDKKIAGVAHEFLFDSKMLNENQNEIYDMLRQLPENFMEGSGGGWSFLMACNDKNGEQWTGLHLRMEQLLLWEKQLEKLNLYCREKCGRHFRVEFRIM